MHERRAVWLGLAGLNRTSKSSHETVDLEAKIQPDGMAAEASGSPTPRCKSSYETTEPHNSGYMHCADIVSYRAWRTLLNLEELEESGSARYTITEYLFSRSSFHVASHW